MKKNLTPLLFLFFTQIVVSQITLSHNVGDDLVETDIYACSWGGIKWARVFNLEKFGITENDEFIISSGNIGLFRTGSWDVNIQFNIYKVDNNFPESFLEGNLIGSSQSKRAPYIPNNFPPQIMKIDFNNPITIPSDVKMILVEVYQLPSSASSALAFAAGTVNDKDFSWFKSENGGCPPQKYTSTIDLGKPNTNFYITVNGEAKTILPFEITNDNNCSNFSNNLSLTNQSEIQSVIWNFDDPNSGANNTSTQINVNHKFTSAGIYNVTATVTHIDNTIYTIPKEIEIFEAPNINKNVSLKQCDNTDINGFSFFNLNEVKEKIVANPENYTITFHKEKTQAENNESPITNVTAYENEQVSSDTIWARVENASGCFEVSEINLLVSTTEIPSTFVKSFYQCDDGVSSIDGISAFDFSSVTDDIINVFPANQQLEISYYKNENDALAEQNKITNITNYQNTDSPNQQTIFVRVDSKVDNACLGLGAHISLNVEKVPIANPVNVKPECDIDRDGLFAFDTSTIQNTIIGNQTNVEVRYFDENGNTLPSPLPNPFVTASQKITARITNSTSQDLDGQCFDETEINFVVNTVPIANPITPQEACDDDFDGIFAFNTSTIESTILGNQTGLLVKYFDENDNSLPSPLPNPFNTTTQTIKVRLENPIYDVCFEEITMDFIVHEKPSFSIIPTDIICMDTNPRLQVQVENPLGNYSYVWRDENGAVVGTSAIAEVVKGGTYSVIAMSDKGCDSDEMTITIQESSLSTITISDIEVQDDSDNNFIRINTSNLGFGDYEFRLLDNNSNVLFDYQDNPIFENLEGGNYILEVNDKNNCGSIPFEIALISFPNFFTPNGDNQNDYWQIKGIDKSVYKSGEVTIYNRFGIPIKNFTISDLGWDGTYNGKPLPANNFWFRVVLVDQNDNVKTRTGNFSLVKS